MKAEADHLHECIPRIAFEPLVGGVCTVRLRTNYPRKHIPELTGSPLTISPIARRNA
jgi:hypothetical protein